MLTGDKCETAISISRVTGLLPACTQESDQDGHPRKNNSPMSDSGHGTFQGQGVEASKSYELVELTQSDPRLLLAQLKAVISLRSIPVTCACHRLVGAGPRQSGYGDGEE